MFHKGEDPCERKKLLAEKKLKVLGKNRDMLSWLSLHDPRFFKGMKTKKTLVFLLQENVKFRKKEKRLRKEMQTVGEMEEHDLVK